MKKQKLYHYIIITGLLCLYAGVIQAQTAPDSGIAKIASRLSVSTEKAQQIRAAYNYNESEIRALRTNKSISPQEKQKQLKELLADRLQKLNAVISLAQLMKLYHSDSTSIAYVHTQAAAMKQRHQQQIDQKPHTQTSSVK